MVMERIRQLVSADLAAVDCLITQQLASDVDLINEIGHYIVNAGGKRLRPILALLSAKVLGYSGTDHIAIAAIIEFIHTATLLHDDVVDESDLRRGRKTTNVVWGNAASVLVGDYIYSRTFQMMVKLNNLKVLARLSDTTNTIAEGEVLQLLNAGNPKTTEADYRQVIERKTAVLFQAATECSALVASQNPAHAQALGRYGLHLGMAFQLVDDILDYTAESAATLGKNPGDDLAEGKVTLPLLHALQQGDPDVKNLITAALTKGHMESFEIIREAVASCGGIDYTYALAKAESQQALDALDGFPESPALQSCRELAEFAVNRLY